jgi:tetratricopeptide (TPR) repeat protein
VNPSLPRLRLLQGYGDFDRADVLSAEEKYDEAMVALQRACRLGELWEFLLERAKTEHLKGDLATALKGLDRAVELRPGRPDTLFERASVLTTLRQWESGGRYLSANRCRPRVRARCQRRVRASEAAG